MDWTTLFPYTLIAVIALFGIGIYGLITSKRFLRIVFCIEILLMAANLLLLSFGLGNDGTMLYPSSLAQTLAIFIVVIGLVFLIIGTSFERILKQSGDSTILDFNFEFEGIIKTPQEEETSVLKNEESREEDKGVDLA
ncbi:MAG: NADH-quinone oxidoreductase subunit K [Candidatus Heimdallarchaeota archaeon]|nr:NADH-quinone oxidoreductase subunit K [Candidatus Heimdallarchaeota archaeon]